MGLNRRAFILAGGGLAARAAPSDQIVMTVFQKNPAVRVGAICDVDEPNLLEACQIVAAGTLGVVRMVRAWWLNNYLGGSDTAQLDGPLDWEQWQGPARRVPLDPYRFRNWRHSSDYAGGIVADQGAEESPAISKASATGFGRATDTHVADFLECVRTRKTPTAPMPLGFPAALVVQMANLSLQLGHRVKWNATLNKVEV